MKKLYFFVFLLFVANITLKAQITPSTDCGIVFVLPDQDFSKYQSDLAVPTSKQCFSHDDAGNLIGSMPCPTTSTNGIKSTSVDDEIALKQDPVDLGDSFVAYPNPTDGLFYLAWNNKAENPLASLQLTSVGSGQTQSVSFTNTNGLTTIDLSAKPPGLYVLQIMMANGSTKSIKIIRK